MSGHDDTKLQHRIDDIIMSAGKIKHAPLTRFDAEIIFREGLMATIKYCLFITMLTTVQYHHMIKIAEPAILSKLGFDRHPSKVVIYGPIKYGCNALINIYIDQIILHAETFMSHIKGKDYIGTLQSILLNK